MRFISTFNSTNPVNGYGPVTRSPGYIFVENWSREAITPTGWETIYTNAETGAAGTSSINGSINRVSLVTDGTGAGDDQSMRTSGLRIDRNFPVQLTGMTMLGMQTTSVQLDLPFSITAATDTELFIGLHSGTAALTALPTTARHLGIYCDISAGANFMLTSSNGTTQVTTDTLIPVDTAAHILRIIWTGEDAATLQLYTAAGATEGTGQTVAAFNLTSGNSHEIHWFIQTEAAAAKTMVVHPYRVAWS